MQRRIARITLAVLGVLCIGCGPMAAGPNRIGRPQAAGTTPPPARSAPTAPARGPWKPTVIAFAGAIPITPGLYRSLQQETYLTAFAPFWYHVTSGGVLQNRAPQSTALPRPAGLHVTPLINQLGFPAWLTSPSQRASVVQDIVTMVNQGGYDGVNIDFEPPHNSVRNGLSAFLQALRGAMPGKMITIDIVPHSGGAYDYPSLVRYTDAIIVMTYDEHGDGTLPGPVASYDWVAMNVRRLLTFVPANKLVLGIADYGYTWTPGSTSATTVGVLQADLGQLGTLTYSTLYGESTSHQVVNGTPKITWIEDAKSVAPKIDLAKRLGLQGVAYWEVGYQDTIWLRALQSGLGLPLPPGPSVPKAPGTAPPANPLPTTVG